MGRVNCADNGFFRAGLHDQEDEICQEISEENTATKAEEARPRESI